MNKEVKKAFEVIYNHIESGSYTEKAKDILTEKLFEIEQNML